MSSDDEVPDHETTLYKNQISTIYIISEFYSISKFNDEKQTKNPQNFSEQISAEATLIFEDVTEEFSNLSTILQHFESWRNRDIRSYKDTYFSLCLPKVDFIITAFKCFLSLKYPSKFQIIGPMIRLSLLTWNPLEKNCKVLEKMEWYETMMKYGFKAGETEAQLIDDPDIRFVPTIMEKMVLPKITGTNRKTSKVLMLYSIMFWNSFL